MGMFTSHYFDVLLPSPFSDKKYAEKTQTEKKCERANTENRLLSKLYITHYRKAEKKVFSKNSYFIAI